MQTKNELFSSVFFLRFKNGYNKNSVLCFCSCLSKILWLPPVSPILRQERWIFFKSSLFLFFFLHTWIIIFALLFLKKKIDGYQLPSTAPTVYFFLIIIILFFVFFVSLLLFFFKLIMMSPFIIN